MILAQPFSRSNRAYQSWSNTGGHAPDPVNQHPITGAHASTSTMPRRPPSSTCQHSHPAASSTYATFAPRPTQRQHPQPHPIRHSATLTRANLERARGAQSTMGMAIGTHQEPKHQPPHTPVSSIYSSHQPQNFGARQGAVDQRANRWRRPEARQVESQHYAATSFTRVTPAPPSESDRSHKSGRDSVLSGMFDRFETLRRRTGWARRRRSGQPSTLSSTATNPIESQQKRTYPLKADEIYAEGLIAIDGNISKRNGFKEDDIEDGQIRGYVDEKSKAQPEFRLLVALLTNWINDELAHQRIIVKDLCEDLYDGQVLGKLFEKLHGVNIDLVEVTQNTETQRHKLNVVLGSINRVLSLQARWAQIRWSVEGINDKNLVEILHLLITLARYYRAPIELPANVAVEQQTVQRINGQIIRRSHQVVLTGSSCDIPSSVPTTAPGETDAFDVLFSSSSSEKLLFVQQSLMRFCNRHLNKIDMTCSIWLSSSAGDSSQSLDPKQFSDGLLLVFLISSVENYFVPLGNLFSSCRKPTISACYSTANVHSQHVATSGEPCAIANDMGASDVNYATAIQPTSYTNTQSIEMLHNVNLAFQLMEEAGLYVRKLARPEDIVNGNLKSLLRVLFALFSRYKHL